MQDVQYTYHNNFLNKTYNDFEEKYDYSISDMDAFRIFCKDLFSKMNTAFLKNDHVSMTNEFIVILDAINEIRDYSCDDIDKKIEIIYSCIAKKLLNLAQDFYIALNTKKLLVIETTKKLSTISISNRVNLDCAHTYVSVEREFHKKMKNDLSEAVEKIEAFKTNPSNGWEYLKFVETKLNHNSGSIEYLKNTSKKYKKNKVCKLLPVEAIKLKRTFI